MKSAKRKTIMIDGVRYYAERPHDCRKCFFWKNRKVGCTLGNKPWILISGDKKPAEVVKSRFMKLNSSHIEYVLQCLSDNTTRIRNVNQYLLATLFNASTTISPYYRS